MTVQLYKNLFAPRNNHYSIDLDYQRQSEHVRRYGNYPIHKNNNQTDHRDRVVTEQLDCRKTRVNLTVRLTKKIISAKIILVPYRGPK